MLKTTKKATGCIFALALMFAGGYAFAQTNPSGMDTPKSNTKADEQFVQEAASGGMAEVKLGQLAQQKGTSDAVKSFGSRMVSDHSKAGDELKTAASQSNISMPDKMNAKDEATYNRLSKMSGAAFDREYARNMVTDHTHDIAEFRKEAIDGKDDSIKNFASQTLPTLQEHLKLARSMEKAVSSSAANN